MKPLRCWWVFHERRFVYTFAKTIVVLNFCKKLPARIENSLKPCWKSEPTLMSFQRNLSQNSQLFGREMGNGISSMQNCILHIFAQNTSTDIREKDLILTGLEKDYSPTSKVWLHCGLKSLWFCGQGPFGLWTHQPK